MNLRLVVDINLTAEWILELNRHGYSAVHSSTIGDERAEDAVIMSWARDNRHIIFTHDLDFGTLLALTHGSGPSVLQIRGRNVLPEHMGPLVIAALKKHGPELAAGAIVVVDEVRSRVRVLPL